MRASDRPVTTGNAVRDRLASVRGALADAPAWLKVLAGLAAVICFPIALPILLLAALLYAPIALITERRTPLASGCVAIWGAMVAGLITDAGPGGLYVLFILAGLVAVAAHQGVLARCYVPCRTTAWTLLWSMPLGGLALRLWPSHQFIGIAVAVLLACLVLGWRLAKSWQEV